MTVQRGCAYGPPMAVTGCVQVHLENDFKGDICYCDFDDCNVEDCDPEMCDCPYSDPNHCTHSDNSNGKRKKVFLKIREQK